MLEKSFTPVSVRRRCAAQGCANARTDAHSAVGGGDDQVDVGFGQDSGIYRGFTRGLQGLILGLTPRATVNVWTHKRVYEGPRARGA